MSEYIVDIADNPSFGGDEFMEMLAEVTADGFCSWAERKEGGE